MTIEEFEAELANSKELIVDFWAEWCGPCRALGPVLDKLSEETGIEILKVNIDESQELAQREGIQSIPAVTYYLDGNETASFIGARPLSQVKEALGL